MVTALLVHVSLLLTISNGQTTHWQGSAFTNYDEYTWDNYILNCTDEIDCTINCYTTGACYGISIYGPKSAILTINCNAAYGGSTQYPAYPCGGTNVYAEDSTQLHINVYNLDMAFNSMVIYTPITQNINTFITCGMVDQYTPIPNDIPGRSVCGNNNKMYSKYGFNTIQWTYYENNTWALDQATYTQSMYCGDIYQYSCSPLQVTNNGYFNCETDVSQCYFDGVYAYQTTAPQTTHSITATDISTTNISTSTTDISASTTDISTSTAEVINTTTKKTATTNFDDGDCDEDDSMDRFDCDDSDNEPNNECSILIDISFGVCYIDVYKQKRKQLFDNLKQCACKNVFKNTNFDDGKSKNCFINKYKYKDLVEDYDIYPIDDSNNDYSDCILQELFEFEIPIYNENCQYLESIYHWLLDEGSSILKTLDDCNLLYSKNEKVEYKNGFGRVAGGDITIELRDKNGNVMETVSTSNEVGCYSVWFILIAIHLAIFM
eukprot:555944_1